MTVQTFELISNFKIDIRETSKRHIHIHIRIVTTERNIF
jgi:hypothetical protein